MAMLDPNEEVITNKVATNKIMTGGVVGTEKPKKKKYDEDGNIIKKETETKTNIPNSIPKSVKPTIPSVQKVNSDVKPIVENTAKDTRSGLDKTYDAFAASDIGQLVGKTPIGRTAQTIHDTTAGGQDIGTALEKNFGNTLGGKMIKGVGNLVSKPVSAPTTNPNPDLDSRAEFDRQEAEKIRQESKYANSANIKSAPTSQSIKPNAVATGLASSTLAPTTTQQATDLQSKYEESLGNNASDMINKGLLSSEQQASKTAETASTAAVRKAIQAARSAGINKGQSALMGSQVGADQYTNAYQGQLESGQNRYQQATAQFGDASNRKQQLALQAQQLELDAQALEAQGRSEEAAVKRQEKQDLWNVIGSVAGAVGSIFSDENLKEDIKVDNSLDTILKKLKPSKEITLDSIMGKIKPINYKYKDGVTGEKETHIGVTAQDLEKTPLAGAVSETPVGKIVDAGQVELGNLALIIELASEVKRLKAELGGKK